ncbi:hypothetical protein FBEOM_1679 [Fusarium beomiforme]|uniref:Uncharacterized protein n=1 Tax=Fusarium beomiforme TaxID=44412 RepID=A0A9P5ASR4_9HYPO|nr:hypothetical protein FBEOM_1679 [Fusarium beomiforme]
MVFIIIAIIVLLLRSTNRGASMSSWLFPHQESPASDTLPKATDATAGAASPLQVPELRSTQDQMMNPNPITEEHRKLDARIFTIKGAKGISETVDFEHAVMAFAWNVFGVERYAVRPTVERSAFDDKKLVRLAGEPPEGETLSELICDLDTRRYALLSFLLRVIYRRMHPTHDVQECLLPPGVSSCYQLIPLRHVKGREDFISVWREVLVMMIRARYDLADGPVMGLLDRDERKERIDSMASEVADALNLKLLDARSFPEEKIKRGLGGIFGIAANSALLLFGQPSEWEADWVSDDPGRLAYPRIRFMWNGQAKWTRPAVEYTCP